MIMTFAVGSSSTSSDVCYVSMNNVIQSKPNECNGISCNKFEIIQVVQVDAYTFASSPPQTALWHLAPHPLPPPPTAIASKMICSIINH